MAAAVDLTGQVFGRLTVLGRATGMEAREQAAHGRYWRCACACGKGCVVFGGNLTRGTQVSCGCYNAENRGKASLRHGLAKSREQRIWQLMKQRCSNPNNPAWPNYGGRGITVCPRWATSFDAFVADMGLSPTATHSLERRDNNQGYSPENCYWATRKEQARNTRRNHYITCNGETLALGEWAERTGVGRRTIAGRLARGWPVERALSEPAWS